MNDPISAGFGYQLDKGGQEPMTVQTQKAQDRPSTDRIERRIELRASRARVWRAIANATEFGAWFGIKLEGAFAAGATIRGRLTIPNYDHLTLEMQVERIEPERYFSYRWHPYAIDPKVDYSTEPTTLVEFHLEEIAGGGALPSRSWSPASTASRSRAGRRPSA